MQRFFRNEQVLVLLQPASSAVRDLMKQGTPSSPTSVQMRGTTSFVQRSREISRPCASAPAALAGAVLHFAAAQGPRVGGSSRSNVIIAAAL